jgi:hypothetical protein
MWPLGGHFQADMIARKILQEGLWWSTLHKDCREQVKKCDKCQRMGQPLWKNEIPLHSVNPSLPFEIWAIDLSDPFPKRAKRTGVKYIITTVKYLTKWEEEEPVENCTKETMTKFIYENIVTRFGYPLTLINDQGTHFVNGTIEILLKSS